MKQGMFPINFIRFTLATLKVVCCSSLLLCGTFDWNYQELNAIKFTIARRQLPVYRMRRKEARRYSRRLPSGSGNNRGGLKLWFHPIPLFSIGASFQNLLAALITSTLINDVANQWKRTSHPWIVFLMFHAHSCFHYGSRCMHMHIVFLNCRNLSLNLSSFLYIDGRVLKDLLNRSLSVNSFF